MNEVERIRIVREPQTGTCFGAGSLGAHRWRYQYGIPQFGMGVDGKPLGRLERFACECCLDIQDRETPPLGGYVDGPQFGGPA